MSPLRSAFVHDSIQSIPSVTISGLGEQFVNSSGIIHARFDCYTSEGLDSTSLPFSAFYGANIPTTIFSASAFRAHGYEVHMSATDLPKSEQYSYLACRHSGAQIDLIPFGTSGQLFLVEFSTLPSVPESQIVALASSDFVFDTIAPDDLTIPAPWRKNADAIWMGLPEKLIPKERFNASDSFDSSATIISDACLHVSYTAPDNQRKVHPLAPRRLTLERWHVRMGHANPASALRTLQIASIKLNERETMPSCKSCLKQSLKKAARGPERSLQATGDRIFADTHGPLPQSISLNLLKSSPLIEMFSNKLHILGLVHERSGYTRLYYLKDTSAESLIPAVSDAITFFRSRDWAANILHVDWAKSFVSSDDFRRHCETLQVYIEPNQAAESQYQNGPAEALWNVAERSALAILEDSGLDSKFWEGKEGKDNSYCKQICVLEWQGFCPSLFWSGSRFDALRRCVWLACAAVVFDEMDHLSLVAQRCRPGRLLLVLLPPSSLPPFPPFVWAVCSWVRFPAMVSDLIHAGEFDVFV